MDTNGTSNSANMRVQPSIRSFFQPRQPNYAAPPIPPVSKIDNTSPLPHISQSPPVSLPKSAKLTSTIPEQAIISPILEEHIPSLRRINSLLLPISYPDSFYQKIISPDAPVSFSRAILWTDPRSSQTTLVGGMVCRLDPALAPDSTPQDTKYTPRCFDIYIQSLALLSPYRRMGLVAEVLRKIIESATSQPNIKIASLYAHVWTENEEALEWYTSRGFRREDPVLHGYYRRLKPDTAWIFRRRLLPSDHLSSPNSCPNDTSAQLIPCAPTKTLEPPVRPQIAPSARSFQERGPDREWNDLPEDILGSTLKPPSLRTSREGSNTSSRSSSKSGLDAKGKKKRAYPAAAFGN